LPIAHYLRLKLCTELIFQVNERQMQPPCHLLPATASPGSSSCVDVHSKLGVKTS